MSSDFKAKALRELKTDEEGLLQRFGDDFRRVYVACRPAEVKLPEGVTCRTVFGIDRRGIGYGQPLSHPLAHATLRQVHDYPWPNPACVDVSDLRRTAAQWHDRYAVLGGAWSPFWHDAIDLLGMENLYTKMYEEPDLVDALMAHLVDFYLEASRRIFDETGDLIDIFFIGNDFGSQTGPLLGPKLFARFILPHLTRLIDLGHQYRMKVQLHCCGGYEPLIPLLIEARLDALHAVQPCCTGMDLSELKRRYGSKMVFNGAIDSHHVLIKGTPDSVQRETRRVLEIMMPGGGYVAGASHDSILEETPVENVLAMFDAVRECGVYR
jgi:uroporphyrinogen-III decarboxylase